MITISRRQFRVLLGAMASVMAIAVAGLVVGVAGLAGANDTFPDVPTTSPFHDAVGNFFDAGCATGFPDGTYRPQDAVNRQQMARFFNACAGRAEFGSGAASYTAAHETHILGTVQIEAGALGTGHGAIAVMASVKASAVNPANGCEMHYDINQSGGNSGGTAFTTMDIPNGTDTANDDYTASLIDFVPVDGGDVVTIDLVGELDNSPSCNVSVSSTGAVLAQYVPFAGDGTAAGAP